MSLTITPLQNPQTPFQGINNMQTLIDIYFKIVAASNYPALGDLLDLTQLGDLIMSNNFAPLIVTIQSAKAAGLSGFLYGYTPASSNPTLSNGKMQLLTASGAGTPAAPLVDAGAIAYPAGVLADTIIGRASLIRL